MGLSISRELEQALHDARLKAEGENATGVGDVLFNDARFVQCLAATWKSLPSTSRAKISGKRSRTKKAISKSTTKITLAENVKRYLAVGKAAPSTLIERKEVFQFDPRTNRLAQVYKLLCDLDKSHALNRIQRRFLLVVIHRFKKKLCSRLHGDAEQHIALKICQSGLVTESHDSVLKNLTKWVSAGARLDQLANDLEGLGSLILLPDDIGDTIWEVTLPMTGPTHEEMIVSLKKRGICEGARTRWDIPGNSQAKTSVEEVADDFYRYLWGMVDQPLWTKIQTPSSEERCNTLGLLIAAVNAESNDNLEGRNSDSCSHPAESNGNEPVALPHGFSPDGPDSSVAQINSQTLFRPILYNHATVPGQERSGQSCSDGRQVNSAQGTTMQVGDSCVTTSSQWAGHNTQNLDALHTLDSTASLPLIDRATEILDSRGQAVMGNISTTFNPSIHAQLGSGTMLLDSSTNAQQGNSFRLFNPSNHVQLGNPSFCNTTLQEQMRNTYTFDPSIHVRQGNCTSFDITLQEQMQDTSTFFDPSSYVRQVDLSIPPEPLLSFP